MKETEYIDLRNVDLGYNTGTRTSVLKNVTLNFNAPELIGIVGKNGVGKSTLIKTIAGLIPPLSGEIKITGTIINNISIEEHAKKVSVVLTEKISGFNLTVFDVVASGQIPYTDSFHRLSKDHIAVIENCLERCGISAIRDRQIAELSDGMFQKTVIAKALAQQTPIMLLDEPSAFLDYASKHQLFLLLRDLCKHDRKCILLSSHDLDLLLKYCDRILILSDNYKEIVSVEEARQNPAFKDIAGGFL